MTALVNTANSVSPVEEAARWKQVAEGWYQRADFLEGQIKSGTGIIQPLDYPKVKLLMLARTQIDLAYRLKACAKEPWTVEFIESCPPGSYFLDIGANVGPYTLVACANNLLPVAIEPAYPSLYSLCTNLALNNMLDRVRVFWCALAEAHRADWMQLHALHSGAATHVLGGKETIFFHKQLIDVWPLDDLWTMRMLDREKPTYVKIDVDGGEIAVLQGAQNFLRSEWVRGIMIEMQYPEEDQITKMILDAGWREVARYDHRGEVKIAGVCYKRFER